MKMVFIILLLIVAIPLVMLNPAIAIIGAIIYFVYKKGLNSAIGTEKSVQLSSWEQEAINKYVSSFNFGWKEWPEPVDINYMKEELSKKHRYLFDSKRAQLAEQFLIEKIEIIAQKRFCTSFKKRYFSCYDKFQLNNVVDEYYKIFNCDKTMSEYLAVFVAQEINPPAKTEEELEKYNKDINKYHRIIVNKLYEKDIFKTEYTKMFVDQAVKTFPNEYGTWPNSNKINISEKNIKAFQIILQDELRKQYDEDFVCDILSFAIEEKQQAIFDASFKAALKKDGLSVSMSNSVYMYVKCFGGDRSFEGFLYKFFDEENLLYDENELQRVLDNAIEKNKEAIHAQKLKESLRNGTLLAGATTIKDIDIMEGFTFEHFLEQLFTNMGYQATVTKATGDQGADLVISRYNKKTVVQAKCYSDVVGNKSVQEVVGSKSFYGCESAMVITNNYFTPSAVELAKINNVKLVDRDALIELLEQYPTEFEDK